MTTSTPPPAPHLAFDLPRQLVAEGLGTALLLAVVIGSGIMGERLSGGAVALALLGNTLSTGAALVVLIAIFGPVSGAQFNPAVTLAFLVRREMGARSAVLFIAAQLVGAVIGVAVAHAMFGEALWQVSTKLRDGPTLIFSEFIATFGLLATILGCVRFDKAFTPVAVGLYITSAYWFTASTSFANPAVTLARSLSDTFAGIAPTSVPAFIGAQLAGAAAAALVFRWLLSPAPHPEAQDLEGESPPLAPSRASTKLSARRGGTAT